MPDDVMRNEKLASGFARILSVRDSAMNEYGGAKVLVVVGQVLLAEGLELSEEGHGIGSVRGLVPRAEESLAAYPRAEEALPEGRKGGFITL